MQVEVIVPFAEPHIAGFRKGEIVNMPDDKAKSFIAGKLVRPVLEGKTPEFATAPSQRKAK